MYFLRAWGCLAAIIAAGLLFHLAPAHAASAPAASAESGAPGPAHTLANIRQSGMLRVGLAVNAPWVLHDRNGQWSGLEVDFVRQLAKDMHWKLELVPTSWTSAIDDLRAGRFDILAAGLSVTPQRALQLKYSDSYGSFALGLVVNRKSLGKDDLVALETGGKHRIGVLADTVTEDTTKAWLGNSKMVKIIDEAAALQDVRSGKLDGLIAEQPLPAAMARSYPDQLGTLNVSQFGKTAHAFAVRRNDQDLVDVINAWLVSAQAGGFVADREDFWLHSEAWVELM